MPPPAALPSGPTSVPESATVPPVALVTLSPDLPHGLVAAWRRALAPIDVAATEPTIALGESALRVLARILARDGDVTAALSSWTSWANATTNTLRSAQDGLHLVDVHALHTEAAAALLSSLGRETAPDTTNAPDPDDALLPLAEALIVADPNRAALADAIDAAFAVTPEPAAPADLALAAHRHLRQSLADAHSQAAIQAVALERAMRAAIAAQQAESQFPARLKNWQERFAECRATIDQLQARIAQLEQAHPQPATDGASHAADRAALLARIAEMESSTSWRLTGPLRRASRLLRRR